MSASTSIVPAGEAVTEPLLAAAFGDLTVDFEQLLFLARSAEAELREAERELAGCGLRPATLSLLQADLTRSRRRHQELGGRLRMLREATATRSRSRPLLDQLAAEQAALADLIRVERALSAALLGAADWQSPSFLSSGRPAAGRQQGRIRPHWNDYKRDRHLDADLYEHRYLDAMVNQSGGLRALLTSCGMAALTTVLSFLQGDGKLTRPVLAGAGTYHETRLQLERLLPGRLQLVDEADTGPLFSALHTLRPSALFLDTLSNSKKMAVPDLAALLDRVADTDTYLILDNTGLSVACQPFAVAADSVRLIVVESLLKYAQLGLDRANAGIILARQSDADRLAVYREHLGTNIPDLAVHALPEPNRQILSRRLERLQRNALLLAERLSATAGDQMEISYPGLPSHPCAAVAQKLSFRGGYLTVSFPQPQATLQRERAIVNNAIAEAARRNVSLIAGSSFGFDTTRIYLTADGAAYGEPFLRIAAGTEHRLEIERVAQTLAATLDNVTRRSSTRSSR